ncbi:diguanylate cyclase [Desulfurivibrio sp. D14AmB]|uniref:diguanylate cyclase n=1 Tax=Desulfurivibrio sp. D14AmB TaxID=3374370 RepID=UPI00376F2CD7
MRLDILLPNSSSGLDDNFFLTAQRESEALRERLLELYLLYATSRTCSVAVQTNSLFVNIVDLLKNTLRVEEFCLMLRDPVSGLYEMWTADDRVMARAGDCSFRPGEGISGLVVESGEAILVPDVTKEPRFLNYHGLLPDIGSFLSVPLVDDNGRVFGVLNIHKASPNSFREHDKNFFCAVANNLAVALERARIFENACREAMRDELTGLYNRRYLLECGTRELLKARRAQAPMALLLLDLDNFKEVNDLWGHARGDEVLTGLAALLTKNLRQSDVAARYGGEEFVVLLPDTMGTGAHGLAEKLRATVAGELVLKDGDNCRTVTMTVGVASSPEDGQDFDQLLAAADRRLYLGKAAGRNRVVGRQQEQPAIQPAANRRQAPRRPTALRALVDYPESVLPAAVRAVDIQQGREWKSCSLLNASSHGFSGMVDFAPEVGAQYRCRALSGAKKPRFLDFTVQVRHVELLAETRFLIGVRIGTGDAGEWQRVYALLTGKA